MTKEQHRKCRRVGGTYAARMRLNNRRNLEVARIQKTLVPIRTQKEVARIMKCTTQNINAAEKRILWKITVRIRELVKENYAY